MTFTATARPPGEDPRNTCPIPPAPRRAPSRARSRYVPTCLGSPAASGSTVLLLRCAGFPEHQQHVAERRGVQHVTCPAVVEAVDLVQDRPHLVRVVLHRRGVVAGPVLTRGIADRLAVDLRSEIVLDAGTASADRG